MCVCVCVCVCVCLYVKLALENLNSDPYPHTPYVKMAFVSTRFDLQSTNSE